MEIVKQKKSLFEISQMQPIFFTDMVKGVVDIEKEIIALHAEMHSDCEELLLENGSKQENLIGFNIYFDGEIELDSNINPMVNKRLGYPRAGRLITEPKTCELVESIIMKWVNFNV